MLPLLPLPLSLLVGTGGDSCVGGGIRELDGGGSDGGGWGGSSGSGSAEFRGGRTCRYGPRPRGHRVQAEGWMSIDQPSGQQDAFAGYLVATHYHHYRYYHRRRHRHPCVVHTSHPRDVTDAPTRAADTTLYIYYHRAGIS